MEEKVTLLISNDNLVVRSLLVVFILLATYFVKRVVSRYIIRYFEKSSKGIKFDPTQFALLKHIVSALIYLAGIGLAIYIVPPLRTMAVSLFAGAGIMAVVIGFASQAAMSNIVSGIFIAVFKPFRVGDVIKFSDKIGMVEDINLRHTVIRNFENKRYVIPNSVISEETIENFNLTDEKTCKYVDIGISYDSDIDKAIDIIQREAMNHPLRIDPRSPEEIEAGDPMVPVRVLGFGDSSLNLRAWVWADHPASAFRMGCDLNKSIKEAFDREGIEIPFPYRTIVFKKESEDKS